MSRFTNIYRIDQIIGRAHVLDYGHLVPPMLAGAIKQQSGMKVSSFLDSNLVVSQLIAGALLGDGAITKPVDNKNPYLDFHCAWRDHNLYMITCVLGCLYDLELATGVYTKRLVVIPKFDDKHNRDTLTGVVVKVNIRAYSKANRFMMELRNHWYPGGVKRIPSDLGNFLTLPAMAMWLAGDGGSLFYNELALNTQGFSIADQELLRGMLHQLYGLETRLGSDKGYKRIVFKPESATAFAKMVLPWVDTSVHYKLRHVLQQN